jgi:hypothetical protein
MQLLRVADHRWVPCDNGNVPQDAFICGLDKDGSNLYVGRAFHGGDLLPGKIVPSHGCAYVSRNGVEHGVKHYEVRRDAWLCCTDFTPFGQQGRLPSMVITRNEECHFRRHICSCLGDIYDAN